MNSSPAKAGFFLRCAFSTIDHGQEFGGWFMTDQWRERGCPVCRAAWQSGSTPVLLVESIELHARLYQCRSCATYWEESEPYPDTITASAAKARFPEAFPGFIPKTGSPGTEE